jgi:hypothetical protein
MLIEKFEVHSPNVSYTKDHIHSTYEYRSTEVLHREGGWCVKPLSQHYEFFTKRHVPRLG